jgi:hypothetical protein
MLLPDHLEDVLDFQRAEPSIHFLPVPVTLIQNTSVQNRAKVIRKYCTVYCTKYCSTIKNVHLNSKFIMYQVDLDSRTSG